MKLAMFALRAESGKVQILRILQPLADGFKAGTKKDICNKVLRIARKATISSTTSWGNALRKCLTGQLAYCAAPWLLSSRQRSSQICVLNELYGRRWQESEGQILRHHTTLEVLQELGAYY